MKNLKRYQNNLFSAFLDFIRLAFGSEMFRACPLQGEWKVENVDLDQLYEMGNKYGQMVLEGDHKLNVRLRSKKNHTYETFSLVLNVKSQRGLDLSMLNMG